jgi:hypothetical protein
MQVVLPYPVRLLKADFALAPEVWSRDTNGVTFWVKDTKGNVLSSQLIDPRSNPNHQKWNRLEWRSDAGALQIIMEVTDNGSPNYDWTVLSIEDIQ